MAELEAGTNISFDSSVPGKLTISGPAQAPLTVLYQGGWPARPNTSRVVFWLALSESAPDPSGMSAYDVVFKGGNP